MRLRIPAFGVVLLITAVVPTLVWAQPRAGAAGEEEFPPGDYLVWTALEQGLKKQAAARQLASAPDSPETVALLLEANRHGAALQALRRIVERHPDRIAAALQAAAGQPYRFDDDGRGYPAMLRDILAKVRQQLDRLPREAAADAEWHLRFVDPGTPGVPDAPWREQVRAFAATYAGTSAGLRAELERLNEERSMPERIAAQESFARRHAGTTVGAYALYRAATNLRSNSGDPAGADPTERLLRVAALARELQSGAYPDSFWVRQASELVLGYWGSAPRYGRENVTRAAGVFREFLLKPFTVYPANPLATGSGYAIARNLPAVFAATGGDPVAQTDDFLLKLETDAGQPAVLRYLRGLWYRDMAANAKDERVTRHWRGRADGVLLDLARAGSDLYNRKALATLASDAFKDKNCSVAAERYREYVSRFPRSEWAWVAGLRLGQCEQHLGNWARAREAYESVTSTRGVPAPALVLGHTYAGRASEGLDDFRRARLSYERAERAWDPEFADPYFFDTYQFHTRLDEERCGCDARSKADVSQAWLRRRVVELRQTARLPGAVLLERGRFRVAQGDWQNAVAPLEEFIRLSPGSRAAVEARDLAVRARLEIALLQTGPETSENDKRAALAALESIAAEPYGFGVFAAQVTRATLHAVLGSASRGEQLMLEALSRWHVYGAARFTGGAATPLQRDVMDIRDAVFRPYATWPRQQFSELRSSDTPPPFFIATPDVRVTLHDESRVRISAASRLSLRPGALILDEDQVALLERILSRVCGPKDDTRQIQKFWNRFFTMGPGHWGGWIIETLPIVSEVSFIDPARVSAGARLRTGYSGHTQLLTREGGAWKLGRTSRHWME